MKAYAVRMDGCYWLVYAPNASAAKGAILQRDYRPRTFKSLACRRWRMLDYEYTKITIVEWGYPGNRDIETGMRISMPEPFQEAALCQP